MIRAVMLTTNEREQRSRGETKFDRRFTIGKNVDIEKITANLTNGVLTVTAPKKDPALNNAPNNVIQITEGGGVGTVAPPQENEQMILSDCFYLMSRVKLTSLVVIKNYK